MQQCDEGSLHDASLNCPICKPSQADLYTRQARLLVIHKLPHPCRVKRLLTLLYRDLSCCQCGCVLLLALRLLVSHSTFTYFKKEKEKCHKIIRGFKKK
jgi:hypothetical protein